MEPKKHPEKDLKAKSLYFFTVGLVVALSTTLLAFEWTTSSKKQKDPWDFPISQIEEEEMPVVLLQKKATPPPPPPAAVRDPEPNPDPEPFVDPITPDPEPDPVVKVPVLDPEPFVDEPTITKYPEVNPAFVGGEKEMYKYLSEHIKYPRLARDMGVEAKVYVQFIVNTDGSISDVTVLKGPGFGLNKEAERVISQMPKWNPGYQGGRKVRVIYIIPINFALK